MATNDINIEDNLLIVSVTGKLTVNEMIAIILEHYPNNIIKDIIWDLTSGSLSSISQDGFNAIANTVKMAVSVGSRHGGKTIFVEHVELENALSRIYTVIAQIAGVPIKYNVFKTIEEARSWIDKN